jgi:uncharacterized protein YcnI
MHFHRCPARARKLAAASCLSALALGLSATALAHIEIPAPGFAGTNQIVTFNVAHGCTGSDTYAVEITIPKEVTTVRAIPNAFGDAQLETDDTGAVTKVIWKKPDVRKADDEYYQLQLRIAVPDAPFTTLSFPTLQRCRSAAGKESETEWVGPPDATGDVEPAPHLTILPPRAPGWNKFTNPQAISDLSIFDDAEIVWVGDSAYSSNPAVASLIEAEDGVSTLKKIAKHSEIWVKY